MSKLLFQTHTESGKVSVYGDMSDLQSDIDIVWTLPNGIVGKVSFPILVFGLLMNGWTWDWFSRFASSATESMMKGDFDEKQEEPVHLGGIG